MGFIVRTAGEGMDEAALKAGREYMLVVYVPAGTYYINDTVSCIVGVNSSKQEQADRQGAYEEAVSDEPHLQARPLRSLIPRGLIPRPHLNRLIFSCTLSV